MIEGVHAALLTIFCSTGDAIANLTANRRLPTGRSRAAASIIMGA
jgi:hypothetical protein